MSASARDALYFPESDRQHIEPYIPPSPSRLPPHQHFTKPFVTLTFATSLDSQLAVAPGVQTALSGPQSKAMTHFLRSRHDAILVGVGTAIADNPSLNCRMEGVGGYGGEGLRGQPRPIVVDPNGRWEFTDESKVLRLAMEGRGKAPFIITCVEPPSAVRATLENVGGKFLFMEPSTGSETSRRLDWSRILELLSKENLKSVMIEGGGFVINDILGPSFKAYSMVDSVIVTIAPIWLGIGGVQVCPSGATGTLPVTRLKDIKWTPLGEDVVLCAKPNLTLRTDA